MNRAKMGLGALGTIALIAGSVGTVGAASPSASLAPANVRFWDLSATDSQTNALNEIIAGFEAANPGVTVTLEQRATDAHKDALRTALGTDAFPDIYRYWAGLGLGGELVKAGASADLTSYYDQYGWDDRFTAPSLASITQYGGHHGVPYVSPAEALFYNKADFEKAGITTPPTTYDDLVAAADKLKAAGVTPIEFGGTVNWHVMRLLDSIIETKCGADMHDQLNALTASWATTPCVADAFTAFHDWTAKYLQDGFMGVNNDEASQLFYSGDASMALEGSWFNTFATDNGLNPDDFGIYAFPTGTGRLYGFTEANYIGANSKVKDQAAAFLDYFTSPEIQTKYLGVFSPLSVTKGVTASDPTSLDTAWGPIIDGASGIYMNSDQAFPLDVTNEFWRIQNLVATDGIDPAQAGAEFQKFIDAR
jgi:raffinose/stachyose/melibiose transport system substrate-binding protein